MPVTYQIDYLEFPSTDGLKTRRFFEKPSTGASSATGRPITPSRQPASTPASRAMRQKPPTRRCLWCARRIWKRRSARSNSPAAWSRDPPSTFPAAGAFTSASLAAARWRSGFRRPELGAGGRWCGIEAAVAVPVYLSYAVLYKRDFPLIAAGFPVLKLQRLSRIFRRATHPSADRIMPMALARSPVAQRGCSQRVTAFGKQYRVREHIRSLASRLNSLTHSGFKAPTSSPPSLAAQENISASGSLTSYSTIITLGIYSAWAKVRLKPATSMAIPWCWTTRFEYHAKGKQILIGRLIVFSFLAALNVLSMSRHWRRLDSGLFRFWRCRGC